MNSPTDKTESSVQKELRTLRDYVHLLADAQDKSPLPFVAGYPDGRTMAFNEAFARLTGYSEDELRSMQWALYLTPQESHEQEARAMDQLRSTGQPQVYEKEQATKDGTNVPVSVVLNQTTDKDGKVQFYYALVTDLSDRRRAERLQKELQDRQGKGLDAMAAVFEGVAIMGPAGVLEANEHFSEMAGYAPVEIAGVQEGALLAPYPQEAAPPEPGVALDYETSLFRKDGITVPVQAHVQEVSYGEGMARVVRVKDLSERVHFQQDKEQLLKELAEVSEELSGLKQISAISINVAQPELAMETLLRTLVSVTGADGGIVYTREGDRLLPRTVHGLGDRLPQSYTEEVGREFPGNLVSENQEDFVEDAQSGEVSPSLQATGAKSLMGVPMRDSGNILGALVLGWNVPHLRDEREVGLMEITADRFTSAITSTTKEEKVKEGEDLGSMLSEINSELSSSLKLGSNLFK